MGRRIKEKEGKYQVISTVTDSRIHEEEWIPLDSVKFLFILEAFEEFLKEIEKIDQFPKGHVINHKFNPLDSEFYDTINTLINNGHILEDVRYILEKIGMNLIEDYKYWNEPEGDKKQ